MAKEDETPRTNPAEIENLIAQIRGINLEPGSKEKIETVTNRPDPTRVRTYAQLKAGRRQNRKGMDIGPPPITVARGALNAGMSV